MFPSGNLGLQTAPLLERSLKVLENATFAHRINQRWVLRSTETLQSLVALLGYASAGTTQWQECGAGGSWGRCADGRANVGADGRAGGWPGERWGGWAGGRKGRSVEERLGGRASWCSSAPRPYAAPCHFLIASQPRFLLHLADALAVHGAMRLLVNLTNDNADACEYFARVSGALDAGSFRALPGSEHLRAPVSNPKPPCARVQ